MADLRNGGPQEWRAVPYWVVSDVKALLLEILPFAYGDTVFIQLRHSVSGNKCFSFIHSGELCYESTRAKVADLDLVCRSEFKKELSEVIGLSNTVIIDGYLEQCRLTFQRPNPPILLIYGTALNHSR